jgi:hypothetical protein
MSESKNLYNCNDAEDKFNSFTKTFYEKYEGILKTMYENFSFITNNTHKKIFVKRYIIVSKYYKKYS